MISSAETDKIIPALVKALGQMEDITKSRKAEIPTKTGGKYTYTFADLKDVLGYLRPMLQSHGLAVMQTAYTDNGTAVATTILHESGQWIESPALRLPSGQDAQSHGSSITFGRRYSLLALLGLATEDDDGASASRPQTKPPAPKPAATSGTGKPSESATKRAMALFAEAGIADRPDRLAFTAWAAGRHVESWGDVSAAEAVKVTEALTDLIGGRLTVGYLDDGTMEIRKVAA